jgi:PAS domain S-box-containing protein
MDNQSNQPQNPEETAKIGKQQASTQEQIRQLQQRIKDLIDLLRAQQDVLRQRGMNLPSGSLDQLKTLQSRLDKWGKDLVSAQIELGQLRQLTHTASLINSSLDTSDVLNQVIDTVIRLTGAERGYIVLKNKSTGELEYPVARGIDREQLAREEFTVSRTIVHETINSGEAVLTDNARSDDRFKDQVSIVGLALRSILAVPLKVRNDVIGVVYCDNKIVSGIFKQHELNLLAAFANQAAVAIENARLFEATRAQLAAVTETRDLINNIFTSITSGVITADRSGRINTCNLSAAIIIGVPEMQAIGASVHDLLPIGNGTFKQQLDEVQQAGEMQLVEAEPVLADRGKRYWNIIISPLRDAEGVSQGVTIVLDDLTEIRQRKEQLDHGYSYVPRALIDRISELDDGVQEREISVLSSDVRGFTRFSEKLEPEVLMEIINKYLSLASDAIDYNGGVVDKYLGDAVTGLFNTQLNPQEDHAVRAVRAAMLMKSDLLALHEVMPEEQRLYYGVGVHTGTAVLGSVGSTERKEFSAFGEAMEISKLLQENADKGEIMISPQTYELVQEYFECEPRTPQKTKGHDDFTVMYQVVARKKKAATGVLDLESLDF